MKKIRAAIIGMTGYTGEELLRILSKHPLCEVTVLAGRNMDKPRPIGELYPHFKHIDLACENLNIPSLCERADIVFLALPHKVSLEVAPGILKRNCRVIDLSADFRLTSVDTYRQWYGEHTATEYLQEAVYGLPELYRSRIKGAQLVANPGCYPTSIILGAMPVLREDIVDQKSIIIDSKSGVSGAGRKFVGEYFKNDHPDHRVYNIAGKHRHIPEVEQELSTIAGEPLVVTFTPSIIPVERGMASTIYMDLKRPITAAKVIALYQKHYENEPFVTVLPEGELPTMKTTVCTNYCNIGLDIDERAGRLIVVSIIDNLLKGASGQAVQNMNILCGFDETSGLLGNLCS